MDRENFYHLLGLSIDPPETDLDQIESVLKKKQTEWSRLRNHPTKGLLARKYIGMIAEIRRVMSDPKLREKEAQAAQEQRREKRRSKIAAVDRHIWLLAGKGHLNDADIVNLAKKHRVKTDLIQNRIKKTDLASLVGLDHQIEVLLRQKNISQKDIDRLAKHNQIKPNEVRQRLDAIKQRKLDEIDNYLKIRITKEYITAEEIASLAQLHAVGEGEILRRLNCPVHPRGKKGADEVKPLDHTIARVIDENLKIIGQSSLYDFLGAWISSDLETLQKKARAKEMEIRKAGQKDAFVTASGILAGQCLSIFSTAARRSAYDLIRARARLKELDADIAVAGMEGSLPYAYFEVLVKRAVSFGVNPKEAEAYIRDYCQRQAWPLAEPARKNRTASRKQIAMAAAVVAVLAAVSLVYIFYAQQRKSDYLTLLKRVESNTAPEVKLELLWGYIVTHKSSRSTADAQARMLYLQEQILEKDYAETLQTAEAFEKKEHWEKARTVYAAFLEKHPNSAYAEPIEQQKMRIPKMREDQAYERLGQIPPHNYDARMDVYLEYLANFPEGSHIAAVRQLLAEIRIPYLATLQKHLAACETNQDWPACIRLCSDYLRGYPNGRDAPDIHQRITRYQQRHTDDRALTTLIARAEALGHDWVGARQLFLRYLEANPDTTVRPGVYSALAQLDRRERKQLLAQVGGRFVEKTEGVVLDSTTDLMWCVIDPPGLRNKCVDYKDAAQYVAGLTAGGYQDWRLPTPKELIVIYRRKPILPLGKDQWYWTSQLFRRYADGWFTMVTVINGAPGGKGEAGQRDARECGAVRAVRP